MDRLSFSLRLAASLIEDRHRAAAADRRSIRTIASAEATPDARVSRAARVVNAILRPVRVRVGAR